MGALSPASSKSPSTIRFGRYELVQRVGAGGMGEVWMARLPGLGGVHKICVVKKMLPHLSNDTTFVRRFLDEAKVVVHLNHGNIAQVFEMGEVDGEFFIAMEYVEGKTVSKVTSRLREREERFPLPLALYIGLRACDALAYAHRKTDLQGRPLHVVHRDISPSNILVSYEGEVKVIDFGAAQSTMKEAHTAPRVVIGNLAYMSPEQARKRPVDGRADVYSISVVLWELVAWSPLPTGGDHVERWRRAAYPRFVPPSKLQGDIPPFLDQLIMRGLAADPLDRFPTAEALRDELQKGLNQIGAKTSQSTMAALMASLFHEEAAAERAVVAAALNFDPESTDKSDRHVTHGPGPEEVTQPGAGGPTSGNVTLDGSRKPPPPVERLAPPVAGADDFDPEATRAADDPAPERPPPPVEPERRASRTSEDLPTITFAQPSPVRRRRFTDALTADYGPQERHKALLYRALLFAGAFTVGVVIAILVSRLFAAPAAPEATPGVAPAVSSPSKK